MHRGGKLCGPALTVKVAPGDNLMVHKALDIAAPGDVVVVDAGGDLTNSIVGEIMVSYAMNRGLAQRIGSKSIGGPCRFTMWPFNMPFHCSWRRSGTGLVKLSWLCFVSE